MAGVVGIQKVAGEGQGFVWQDSNEPGFGIVNGYRAGATTQLTGVNSVHGNFADLLIGFWSGTDVVVDTITSDSGAHVVKIYQDCDVAVAHEESFSYGVAA